MKKLNEMYVKMQLRLQDEKGATMVEYGLLVALIAAVAVAVVGPLGTKVVTAFTTVSNAMP